MPLLPWAPISEAVGDRRGHLFHALRPAGGGDHRFDREVMLVPVSPSGTG
jgi:hypothetical protein